MPKIVFNVCEQHLVLNLLLRLCALPEAVLEPTGHRLHVPHAPSPDRAAPLGLLSPVVIPHLRGRVAAGRASLLLDVVGMLPAPAARRVGLVVPLSE